MEEEFSKFYSECSEIDAASVQSVSKSSDASASEGNVSATQNSKENNIDVSADSKETLDIVEKELHEKINNLTGKGTNVVKSDNSNIGGSDDAREASLHSIAGKSLGSKAMESNADPALSHKNLSVNVENNEKIIKNTEEIAKEDDLVSPSKVVNDEKDGPQSKDAKEESSDYGENKDSSSKNYAQHTRYEGSECIYTDPETKQEFVWSDVMKQWAPRGYKPVFDGKTYRYTDADKVTHKWNSESSQWEKSDDVDSGSQFGYDGENHTYTDPKDNTVYIWDRDKSAWFPKVDEDFMARYQMSYGFVENTSKDEPVPEVAKKAEKRKPSDPSWFDLDDDRNTKVYVSNLPEDIGEQEFVDFMQKCGLIQKDIKVNKFKIKIYREPDGTPKGDALCDYIKVESVQLALNVLDGSEVRGKRIKVERAKFQMRGDYNPALKPKKKKKKEKEQEKKIQQKLLDWRPDKLRGEREKHERTVVVKNLFDPKIFDANVELILEFTEDIRSEASKCGLVRKVTLYDKNPEGVATITFSDAEEADICIKLLDNRWFGKRKVMASAWDGKTKFKVLENQLEQQQRIDNWNKFLESEERVRN